MDSGFAERTSTRWGYLEGRIAAGRMSFLFLDCCTRAVPCCKNESRSFLAGNILLSSKGHSAGLQNRMIFPNVYAGSTRDFTPESCAPIHWPLFWNRCLLCSFCCEETTGRAADTACCLLVANATRRRARYEHQRRRATLCFFWPPRWRGGRSVFPKIFEKRPLKTYTRLAHTPSPGAAAVLCNFFVETCGWLRALRVVQSGL